MTGAQLTDAELIGANLADADLGKANLTGAWLYKANLVDADLTMADLAMAENLTQQQLDSARGDDETKLPTGLRRPDHWSARPAAPPTADP